MAPKVIDYGHGQDAEAARRRDIGRDSFGGRDDDLRRWREDDRGSSYDRDRMDRGQCSKCHKSLLQVRVHCLSPFPDRGFERDRSRDRGPPRERELPERYRDKDLRNRDYRDTHDRDMRDRDLRDRDRDMRDRDRDRLRPDRERDRWVVVFSTPAAINAFHLLFHLYCRPSSHERFPPREKFDYRSVYADYKTPEEKRPPPKKVETLSVEDVLCNPGRKARPEHIVVIVRGLPGSGKTYVSKLLKEKEIKNGGAVPRMLCIDDYFMVEVEKTDKDPDSGKRLKKTVMEYEYDPAMEETYRRSLLKSYKRQIDERYFNFIIVDAIFNKGRDVEEFWSYGKSKGFQVGTCLFVG